MYSKWMNSKCRSAFHQTLQKRHTFRLSHHKTSKSRVKMAMTTVGVSTKQRNGRSQFFLRKYALQNTFLSIYFRDVIID